MKVTNEEELYRAIAELKAAKKLGMPEKEMALIGTIYTFLDPNYVTKIKSVLRRYRSSNIRPYDFDDKDGFLDFFHHVFVRDFIDGDAFTKFEEDKKDFASFLIIACQWELNNIIKKNNKTLPSTDDYSENEGLKFDNITHTHALLFEGDLQERMYLYCCHQALSTPSEVRQGFVPNDMASYLLWRNTEVQTKRCDSDTPHI